MEGLIPPQTVIYIHRRYLYLPRGTGRAHESDAGRLFCNTAVTWCGLDRLLSNTLGWNDNCRVSDYNVILSEWGWWKRSLGLNFAPFDLCTWSPQMRSNQAVLQIVQHIFSDCCRSFRAALSHFSEVQILWLTCVKFRTIASFYCSAAVASFDTVFAFCYFFDFFFVFGRFS